MTALKRVASVIPKFVASISLDDKSRVYLGRVPIASQRPVVMGHRRVRLPNHSFQIAPGHNLVPSVYIGLEIRDDMHGNPEAVGRSGPMHVEIRSGAFPVFALHGFWF